MSLVVDASVGLKWVLEESDSASARSLLREEPDLLCPDFWLHEAANVLWREVKRGLMTPEEARAGLRLLTDEAPVTSTAPMRLHGSALEISTAVGHSTYDTMYVAFALHIGAEAVIVSDAPFVRAMRSHPDVRTAMMVRPLTDWARSRGLE